MIKFTVADFNIQVNDKSKELAYMVRKFKKEFFVADVSFEISEDDITYERKTAEYDFSDSYIKFVACSRKISEWLPFNNAFLLHSAVVEVDGQGIAFAAHSGTGKTTHMNLWYKLLGDRMKFINGDKPFIRFFDTDPSIPYAYGSPWCGKERMGSTAKTPLKHICFIERSETNFVEPMEKADAIERIFNQVYKPSDPVAVMKTMQLIDRLLSCCKLWTIHCNMEDEAAEVAYNAIIRN